VTNATALAAPPPHPPPPGAVEVYCGLLNLALLTFCSNAIFIPYRESLTLTDDILSSSLTLILSAYTTPQDLLARLLGFGQLVVYPLIRQLLCCFWPKQHLVRWVTLWLSSVVVMLSLQGSSSEEATKLVKGVLARAKGASGGYVAVMAVAYGLVQLLLGFAVCIYTEVTARREFLRIKREQEQGGVGHAHQD
jgi:hypothetical protein